MTVFILDSQLTILPYTSLHQDNIYIIQTLILYPNSDLYRAQKRMELKSSA